MKNVVNIEKILIRVLVELTERIDYLILYTKILLVSVSQPIIDNS